MLAQPKIRAYYEEILADFSINDTTHALHYLLKILENMKQLDKEQLEGQDGDRTESTVDTVLSGFNNRDRYSSAWPPFVRLPRRMGPCMRLARRRFRRPPAYPPSEGNAAS